MFNLLMKLMTPGFKPFTTQIIFSRFSCKACMGSHTLSSPMTSVHKVKAMTYMIDMPQPIKITGAYVASFRSGVWK